MDRTKILQLSRKTLNVTCYENRHRDAEIMQGIEGEKKHAKTVLSWVKKLHKNPSMELEIAALFHDIDRVITTGVGGGFKGDRKSKEYELHKKLHAQRSADYICSKLIQNGVAEQIVKRIDFLVRHHDDNGSAIEAIHDHDLNILVAADSFAFFTSIAPKLYRTEGEERLKDKIRFMIEKMPIALRRILQKQKIPNAKIDRVKRQVLKEFKL